MHDVLVTVASPSHLLASLEAIPRARDAIPWSPHQHDLLLGGLLMPQEAEADGLVVQASFQCTVELDQEDVAGLPAQPPGDALPLAVGAVGRTASARGHDGWVEDLPPVLVPHDLELVRSAQEAHLLGVVASGVALLQLVEAPGVQAARDVVLALDGRIGGQGLRSRRRAGLVWATYPLPVDRTPLTSDAQGHQVLVAHAHGAIHHGLHLAPRDERRRPCGGTLRVGGPGRPLVVLQHRQSHAAVDEPVQAERAAVGALGRRAVGTGGAARVQREVRVAIVVDLELLEAVHAEGHREGPAAGGLPRHPLGVLESVPRAGDVEAVGGLGELLAAAARPEDHGLVGVAGLRRRDAVGVHAAAADAAAHGAAPADGHDRIERALRGVQETVLVDEHAALHEVADLRIDGPQVKAWLLPTVGLAVESLHHCGQGAALDAIAEIRLESRESQRDAWLGTGDSAEGCHLHGVIHHLPIGMALHSVQAAAGYMALAAGLRHQELHGGAVRRAEARLHARVVDLHGAQSTEVVAALVDDGDALHLLREVVDRERHAALALHPAAGRLVEGEAAAHGANLAQAHAVDPRQGRERHRDAHAHGHRGVLLPLVQGHHPGLEGREAAGGVRIELHAGTVHAKDEGEAVGHDRPSLAGTC
mmetsp:Transcript_36012/g.107606  ORF Transcript_36012/g.107606 Transcript_36012/m.107606 type:complete len:647 (-) Transcript_36012:1314-3254(-)